MSSKSRQTPFGRRSPHVQGPYSMPNHTRDLFAVKLQRRSEPVDGGHWRGCMPSITPSALEVNGTRRQRTAGRLPPPAVFVFPALDRALPTLHAATTPEAKPIGYYCAD